MTTKQALLAEFKALGFPTQTYPNNTLDWLAAAIDRVARETWGKAVDAVESCDPFEEKGKTGCGEGLNEAVSAVRNAAKADGHDLSANPEGR